MSNIAEKNGHVKTPTNHGVVVENIPPELKALPRWVCWKRTEKGKGKGKPPINPMTGDYAKVNDPDTWGSFDDALHTLNATPSYHGLSFMLNGDGIVGIDLDDCCIHLRQRRVITNWAVSIIKRFNSYTEITPSGMGVRIFVRGNWPDRGRRKEGIEVYATGKALTVTGVQLREHGAGEGIQDRAAELLAWHAEVFGESPESPESTKGNIGSNSSLVINSPESINQRKFEGLFLRKPEARQLFIGECNGFPSQSEVDLALANYGAWDGYTDQGICDLLVVARLNGNEESKPVAYYERTIAKAREGVSKAKASASPPLTPRATVSPSTSLATASPPASPPGPSRAPQAPCKGMVNEVVAFLGRYIVMPRDELLVTGAWVASAWLADVWDRFPHLLIKSPEKRCGKTKLLQLLQLITPRARNTANVSGPAIFRLIEAQKATLLIDEAQSLKRLASESSEVIRELLNASIDRNAVVLRCGGDRYEKVLEFKVYGPKVIAQIGELDGVLADRCLPIVMMRKTDSDRVERIVSRRVEPIGQVLHDRLAEWAKEREKEITAIYDNLDPFNIRNDRMAELLMPLQAVLTLDGIDASDDPDASDGSKEDTPQGLRVLQTYAEGLDATEGEEDAPSPGVRLLAACRRVFGGNRCSFLATDTLIRELVSMKDEPWGTWSRGSPITPHALSHILKDYGIRPERNKEQTYRGYARSRFQDAWSRYLPPETTV